MAIEDKGFVAAERLVTNLTECLKNVMLFSSDALVRRCLVEVPSISSLKTTMQTNNVKIVHTISIFFILTFDLIFNPKVSPELAKCRLKSVVEATWPGH